MSNEIFKWFYKRNEERVRAELFEAGLALMNEDKFHKHIEKMTKRSIMETAVIIILIIFVVVKWITGWS